MSNIFRTFIQMLYILLWQQGEFWYFSACLSVLMNGTLFKKTFGNTPVAAARQQQWLQCNPMGQL